jgi:holo-[acyl-carrier protein] synthase
MVIGIGLDLLDIDRLGRALGRRPSLADRLFTRQEQAYAATRARPAQHLAARFCAKEAVTKALGLDVMRALEIEVVGGGAVGVRIALTGETARWADERSATVLLSLTHTPTVAGASVVVEGTPA